MFGQRHHFISYSTVEALEFAAKLHNLLEGGYPKIPAWLDKHNLKPGMDWDNQIPEAIRDCDSVLFVMTPDSVLSPNCKDEWSLALKYKKPVVPLLLKKCDPPFRLQNRQYIDFSKDVDAGIAKLREHLQWLASPEGELQRLKDQLADAERDLRRAMDEIETARIQDEMTELKKSIARQEEIVRDPEGVAARTQQSINTRMEGQRQPEKPVSGIHTSKFINPPPGIAPDYFQDRHVETKQVADFLRHESQRLITVVGRGGVGKTAMVCRLLKGLESSKLPDDLPIMSIDGIVYLSEAGTRKANVANLFSDLGKLLPKETAMELESIYKNPQVTTESKVQRLLEAFPIGRYVLLLDNFEDVLDENREIKDTELNEALKTFLNAPQHSVKVIITTRVAPRDLLLTHPERQRLPALELDSGLGSPYAENVLREMDTDGKLGLKNTDEATLKNACEQVMGYPRALEALVAALAADRETSLNDILMLAEKELPENVTQVLVGEAFNRLEPSAQKVIQALAIYGRPVPEVAVDYLLQPYIASINSAPVLGRLVNMHFVRRETGLFYLHPVDKQYALSLLPKGEESDRFEAGTLPFTQVALHHRGAEYFASTRKPREEWKKLEDLRPQLDEFDLRCEAEDWDTAADVLTDIDFEYLLMWGHYRIMVVSHERLQGKITNWMLAKISVGHLGAAYGSLGDITRSIINCEQALQLAQEHDDQQGTSTWLCNLATAYSYLGKLEKSIEYYERGLAIDREIGNKEGEGYDLAALGEIYHAMGHTENTSQYYDQALAIFQETDDRSNESYTRKQMGDALSDQGKWVEATQSYEWGLKIADEISFQTVQSNARCGLAFIHLNSNDYISARKAVEAASQYDVPENNHNVFALLGVIALRQEDIGAAQSAFREAIAKADAILEKTAQYYTALDAKGIALCGLALCTGDTTYIEQAKEAFQAAREITKAKGIIGRVVRLFDGLAVADKDGMLIDVRAMAAGDE
ncbi:MAG: TIR domain-containing protein [Anaerolineaceae bacterium]|nr:TIR domain-containing protein [Anaerolineaceae bacterium]